MKNLFRFLLFSIIAFSCDFNEYPELTTSNQKWVISGYQKGGESNPSYISVRDSAFVYSLSSDGTFRRTIGKNGTSGVYEERVEDGLRKIIFNYESSEGQPIHSCNKKQEEFFLNSQGQLTGTWDACDGIKLYFDKH